MRLLLVEDDETLREAYRLVLEARDLEVVAAATGEEALSILGAVADGAVADGGTDFDAVVVDPGVPDPSGAELVRRLRRRLPGAALVVLTGRDDGALREECLAAGADAFHVKPLPAARIAEAIGAGPPDG